MAEDGMEGIVAEGGQCEGPLWWLIDANLLRGILHYLVLQDLTTEGKLVVCAGDILFLTIAHCKWKDLQSFYLWVFLFSHMKHISDTSGHQMSGVFSLKQFSATPAGCPMEQLNSNTIRLGLVSEPAGWGLSPTWLPHPSPQTPVASSGCFLCFWPMPEAQWPPLWFY